MLLKALPSTVLQNLFINGHAGNTPTIEDVARKLRREKGIVCFSIDLWQGLTPEAKKKFMAKALILPAMAEIL